MKKIVAIFVFAIFVAFAADVPAQTRTPEPPIQRDQLLEQDQLKNLEVVRHYFTTKKAYKAVLLRCDEIVAAYPEFSKMDEVLYLAGMSSLYLSENKGKQKLNPAMKNEAERFAPAKLREDAIANLNLLVEKYPQSEFKGKAEKTLKLIDKK